MSTLPATRTLPMPLSTGASASGPTCIPWYQYDPLDAATTYGLECTRCRAHMSVRVEDSHSLISGHAIYTFDEQLCVLRDHHVCVPLLAGLPQDRRRIDYNAPLSEQLEAMSMLLADLGKREAATAAAKCEVAP